MSKKKWVIGNWKLNGSRDENRSLIAKLREQLNVQDEFVHLGVCPTYTYLEQVEGLLEGSSIELGAQNVSEQSRGAFTGEVAAEMLKDVGVHFVIIGHSERRAYQAETDSLLAKKIRATLDTGLIPVLCVGETKQERDENRTKEVLVEQLEADLAMFDLTHEDIIIAYEPRWAIGTGISATPEMIAEVHAFLYDYLQGKAAGLGDRTSLLYGGSMNATNAATIAAIPHVDGGLIGSAALKAEDFIAIYRAVLDASHPVAP